MKEATAVGLVVALLYFSQRVTAGGTLNFVTLYSPTTLQRIDDTSSSPISIDGGFPFGTGTIYTAYISENGYISNGDCSSSGSLSSSSSCSVVAPYGADINTEIAGTVRYTDFDTYISSGSAMTTVSRFIRNETGDNFYGSKMMVAEWDGVAKYTVITSTFQGILITDGFNSYAVFIYECGGMEWSRGEIGWRDGSSEQVSHSLSDRYNSDDIGCLYSNTYSAVVYRLHSTCDFNEFTCYNGECQPGGYVCDHYNDCGDYSDEEGCPYYPPDCEIDFECDNGDCVLNMNKCDGYNDCGDNSDEHKCGENNCFSYEIACDNGWTSCIDESYKCDGNNDCGDNSDEDGCDVNVGLAVGLSVGLVFLILVIGVPLCIGMRVYCLSRRSNRPVQTRIVATNPVAGATTAVTSSQAGTSTAAPVQYSLQPVYKDAQFSNQDAPPSYADAIAYPQAAQDYNQYQPNSAAAHPQQQNTSYPPQNQVNPQAVLHSNQAYPPVSLAYPPA